MNGLVAVDKMGGKVLFLDPTTLATEFVLNSFAPKPHELLVVEETMLAYVPIFGDGIHGNNPNPGHLISIVDLNKRSHIGDIDLDSLAAPHSMRLGPKNHIYVTCEDSGVVAVVETMSHQVVGTIESGSTNSHRLEISPDGKHLYTENEEDRSITVVDLATQSRLRMIDLPHALSGLAVTPDNNYVIAVSDEEPVFFLADPLGQTKAMEIVLQGLDAPAQVARYAPDYRLLAITSLQGNTVSLLSPDFTEQVCLPIGSQPLDMAFCGNDLFVACQGDGTIHQVDLTEKRAVGEYNAGVGCETLAFY